MVAVTLIHQALWELASIWAKVTRHLPSGHPGPIQFSCTSGSASPLPNSFSTRTSAFLLHGTDAQSIPLHYSLGDPCCLITYLRHIDSVLISHTPHAAFLGPGPLRSVGTLSPPATKLSQCRQKPQPPREAFARWQHHFAALFFAMLPRCFPPRSISPANGPQSPETRDLLQHTGPDPSSSVFNLFSPFCIFLNCGKIHVI